VCGSTVGGLSLEGIDVAKETVIQGVVENDGHPVPGAFVRLLDASGEFTAEVVTSATGGFRFFAAPGSWTVRALSSAGAAQSSVEAAQGSVAETTITL
jgi:uncharacterized GH25 family protein